MPKISIIIPIYNSAEYLDRCISSVLSQTFDDFELILVDDGSTDSSPEIIDRYALADPRVKVIHQCNSGVSVTRNHGIETAHGEWITFVDSDDYVTPDYLNDLYEMALADDCDMVVTGSRSGADNVRTYQDVVVDRDHIQDLIGVHKIHLCCPVWGKLFRAAMIRDAGICFNVTSSWSEDIMFIWTCLTVANRVRLSSKINYFYEIRPNSVSKYLFSHPKEAAAFVYANNLQSKLKARFGDEFVIRNFGLRNFLNRAVQSLYSGKYTLRQRLSLMSKIHYQSCDIEYSTPGRLESLYKYALKYRLWPLVEVMNMSIIPKMGIKFKD